MTNEEYLNQFIFYRDEMTTIYCGDSIKLMPQLPMNSIDLAIIDPPLSLQWVKFVFGCLKPKHHVFSFWTKLDIGNAQKAIGRYFTVVDVIPWIRKVSWTPIIHAVQDDVIPGRESLVFSAAEPLHKYQPAQKPEEIIRKFIGIATKEGDTVLDPYLGSGTTAVVAREMKRKCIGMEINRTLCETTVKRLK